MGTGGSFPGVKRQVREADHSPPTIAEVKKMWIYTSTPPYAFTFTLPTTRSNTVEVFEPASRRGLLLTAYSYIASAQQPAHQWSRCLGILCGLPYCIFCAWSVLRLYNEAVKTVMFAVHPCGGGVEYLHRDPESSSRRRKEKAQIWNSKIRMITSPKRLGPEKDYAGKGQQHLQKTDLSSRQRGPPQK
jgi:hypothetical protein